ncbi:MAG: efflux RND transporter periplasmic adaptor subunit [Saprospiraceae bacterium]
MDRKIEKKKWTWQKILMIAIPLLLLSYIGNGFYISRGTSKLNVQKDRLLTDVVKRGNFQDFIPVTGVVLPIRNVQLGAIEGGRVEERFVEDGTMVKAGQSILRLSNPDLQLNYLNQEANIVSQINQIRNTSLMMEQQSLNMQENAINVNYQLTIVTARLQRNKKLYAEGVISNVDYTETKAEHESLLARKKLLTGLIEKDRMSSEIQQKQMEISLDLMQRNLKIAQQSLDNLSIKAPIDGQLSGLGAELGELIIEGSQIAQIDDLTKFKIRVRIDEFYISRIYTQLKGSFNFAGENYELYIQKIFPQVTNGTFEADMSFTKKAPEGIKRGQTVSVKLELSAQEEALIVQRGSFYQTTGGNWVYVLDPTTNIARKREIRVGRQNPNYYEILDGLTPGEIVITSSYENYGDKDELILQ